MGFLQKIKSLDRMTIIKNSFLVPILLVVIMSISHVVSWYDIGNPISWAIYLSVAIEIFALASVSAASVNINRASVWFLFTLVTSIQIVGNIFFEYNDIDTSSKIFQSWKELIQPLFEDWDVTAHKRFLATIQGGTLPLMSLTALHYYIKFGDKQREVEAKQDPKAPKAEESLKQMITDYKEEISIPEDKGPVEVTNVEPPASAEDAFKVEAPAEVKPEEVAPEQPEVEQPEQKKEDDDDIAPYTNHHE